MRWKKDLIEKKVKNASQVPVEKMFNIAKTPLGVVIHMPVGYTELYAKRLNNISELEVVEAKDEDLLEKGKVYIAPAGKHMLFEKRDKIYKA